MTNYSKQESNQQYNSVRGASKGKVFGQQKLSTPSNLQQGQYYNKSNLKGGNY